MLRSAVKEESMAHMEIFNVDSIFLRHLSSKVRKHRQYLPLPSKRTVPIILNSRARVLLHWGGGKTLEGIHGHSAARPTPRSIPHPANPNSLTTLGGSSKTQPDDCQALCATEHVNTGHLQKDQALINSTNIFLKVAIEAKGHREAELGGANRYKDHLPL